MSNILETTGVTKIFPSAPEPLRAVSDVSLKIEAGDFLALVGPSGAGKSTLLHILGGIERPTQGEVLFEGKSLYRLWDRHISRWRNRHIGFVFQFYHLITELNVLENVLLPNRLARKKYPLKKVRELLQYLGIDQRRKAHPARLSGGEKQRVAIARALINDPQILLCDEPTGNLDIESQAKVMDLLTGLNREQNKTIILVTHNMDLAKRAKRIVHIDAGRLRDM